MILFFLVTIFGFLSQANAEEGFLLPKSPKHPECREYLRYLMLSENKTILAGVVDSKNLIKAAGKRTGRGNSREWEELIYQVKIIEVIKAGFEVPEYITIYSRTSTAYNKIAADLAEGELYLFFLRKGRGNEFFLESHNGLP